MNENEINKKINMIIDNSIKKLLNQTLQEDYKSVIKHYFKKNFTKLSFILMKTTIFINFLEEIKGNSKKYLKNNENIKEFSKFYNNIIECDYYLYKIFENLKKIPDFFKTFETF